jgi:hypothetical protein
MRSRSFRVRYNATEMCEATDTLGATKFRKTPTLAVLLLVALVLGACGTDRREWMKLDQTYTTAEFQRDLQECTVKGKLDDDCMKARGWVAVTPPKAEQKKEDPLSQPAGRSPRR